MKSRRTSWRRIVAGAMGSGTAVVEALLEERTLHEEGTRAFSRADDRLKAWAKARSEERLTVGRWLLEKKPLVRGVRVKVRAVGERAPAAVE